MSRFTFKFAPLIDRKTGKVLREGSVRHFESGEAMEVSYEREKGIRRRILAKLKGHKKGKGKRQESNDRGSGGKWPRRVGKRSEQSA